MLKNPSDPVARAGKPADGKDSLRLGERGSETILIVEDEDAVRTIARRILESYGYVVIEADVPERALALCASTQTPVHLLLSDLVMPGMNGQELSRRLVELRPDLRVLFMSGYADAPQRYGLTERDRFLAKPFSPVELARMVRETIDARDWS